MYVFHAREHVAFLESETPRCSEERENSRSCPLLSRAVPSQIQLPRPFLYLSSRYVSRCVTIVRLQISDPILVLLRFNFNEAKEERVWHILWCIRGNGIAVRLHEWPAIERDSGQRWENTEQSRRLLRALINTWFYLERSCLRAVSEYRNDENYSLPIPSYPCLLSENLETRDQYQICVERSSIFQRNGNFEAASLYQS